eukprot:1016851-Pleurochrysis_carterae.AAC.1
MTARLSAWRSAPHARSAPPQPISFPTPSPPPPLAHQPPHVTQFRTRAAVRLVAGRGLRL